MRRTAIRFAFSDTTGYTDEDLIELKTLRFLAATELQAHILVNNVTMKEDANQFRLLLDNTSNKNSAVAYGFDSESAALKIEPRLRKSSSFGGLRIYRLAPNRAASALSSFASEELKITTGI